MRKQLGFKFIWQFYLNNRKIDPSINNEKQLIQMYLFNTCMVA